MFIWEYSWKCSFKMFIRNHASKNKFQLNKFQLDLLGSFLKEKYPSKIGVCCLITMSTRYSLVKGERIIRYVLTAQLHKFWVNSASLFISLPLNSHLFLLDVGFLHGFLFLIINQYSRSLYFPIKWNTINSIFLFFKSLIRWKAINSYN